MTTLPDRLRQHAALHQELADDEQQQWARELLEAADEIERLTAEVAGLREDAARYLYLREKCPWTVCVDGDDGRTATVSLHIKVSKDLMVADGEDDFDAAIDAARKGEA